MKVPQRPPSLDELFSRIPGDRLATVLRNASPTSPEGKYRHWETMRRIDPPGDLSSEEWWLQTKFARTSMMKRLPLTDADGRPFTYALPDPVLAMLHMIDQRSSGEISISEVVTNPATRDRYVVNSLIEEAITSSQLEGAVTSRVVAKEMIRSGRQPRDVSERMILNNYHAIHLVRDHRRDQLTPELVCQLQRVLTEDTLDHERVVGRIQQPDDDRVRAEAMDGEVLHIPPPAVQLPKRLELMCEFANGDNQGGFLHPVLRAILLHFWLAYDHPFVDGNGRTARALFYWSMLKQGYWLSEYLSISRILRAASAQYGRSFLYTETDDNDTTYFILYQLKVVCRAIDELYKYLDRKMAEIRNVEVLLKSSVELNHRQLALLSHALRQPGGQYTFRSHANSHGVVYQSARSDLLDLHARGLLERRKSGRAFVFHAPPDVAARLREMTDAA